MTDSWHPHVTVATIVERAGKFLLVEEHADGVLRLNQPAGHWEPGETLAAGAIRETLEETAHHIELTHLLGVYRWLHPGKEVTYLRFAFVGEVTGYAAERPLDAGIVRALWLTSAELEASAARHRSPLVLRCVADYLSGKRYPLSLITHYA